MAGSHSQIVGVVLLLLAGCGEAAPHTVRPIDAGAKPDSAEARDRAKFHCGALSGAVTASLLCDRIFPDLNWDFEPHYALVSIAATIDGEASGPDAALSILAMQGVGFEILTPPPAAPMTETCENIPPLPLDVWSGFRGGFGNWFAACNTPNDVLAGSSFELSITSVGVLTRDALGADPLDASADGFDWDSARTEVLSNTFHGTFRATLVAGDAGDLVYVDMQF